MNIDNLVKKGKIEYKGLKYDVYAHSNKGDIELYHEHILKSWMIFSYFLERQDIIFQDIFNELRADFSLNLTYNEFKKLLECLVFFHDVGKVNPKFQIEKMGNSSFKDIDQYQMTHSNHSLPSAFVLTHILKENHNLSENPVLYILPFIVAGHHTQAKNPYNHNLLKENLEEKDISTLKLLFNLIDLEDKTLTDLLSQMDKLHENLRYELRTKKSPVLPIFYNLVYSYLVLSDFLATTHAYDKLEEVRKNLQYYDRRLDNNLLKKMSDGFEKKQTIFLDNIDKTPLNRYRTQMFVEARKNLLDNLDSNRVFFLKIPTSGGKTHISLGLSLEILKKKNVDRLIYSLPYISILEQNFSYIKEVFNLDEPKHIRPIYSGTETIFNEKDNIKDRIINDDDFYNYPVICTTNVSFFNSVVKFNKKHKYRFSSIANSVVVLDEVQSLPIEYWPELIYLINKLAKHLNIYFIIMSATIPSLEQLKTARGQNPVFEDSICYLMQNTKKYFSKFEKNVMQTKTLKTFNLEDTEELKNLKRYLGNVCEENFRNGFNHGMLVVNTVRTSRKLFEVLSDLNEETDWDADIRLLNSTFLPWQKTKLVKTVENLASDQRFILISTQSVEAGMNISFNFVIRDIAILDSIEQIRGRCNRNKENEDNGKVYLIELKRGNKFDHNIYRKWRVDITKKILEDTEFDYNLKCIEEYYNLCVDYINKKIEKELKLTSADNIEAWCELKFEETNSFRNRYKPIFHVDIIKENFNPFSFLLEVNVPLDQFSKSEIEYMTKIQKDENITLMNTDNVVGAKFIGYYSKKIEEIRKSHFQTRKIFNREINSILSKFVFNTSISSYDDYESVKIKLINIFQKNRVGAFFVITKEKIGDGKDKLYSLDKGVNKKLLNNLPRGNVM